MNKTIYSHNNYVAMKHTHYCRATLCAVYDGTDLRIGSSVCSRKDRFKKKIGRQIALKRALSGEGIQKEFGRITVETFIIRCMKYFKGVTYQDIIM